MWQLVINGPGRIDVPYHLEGQGAVVGRDKECDIVLSGQPVSRRHARFELRDDGVYFEDLGSRNGSKVNGQKTKGRVPVRAGDMITIGDFNLALRRLARLENLELGTPHPEAGGVHRFRSGDVKSRILLSRSGRSRDLLEELESVSAEEVLEREDAGRFRALILHSDAVSAAVDGGGVQTAIEQLIRWLLEKTAAQSAVLLLRHREGLLVPVVVCHTDAPTSTVMVCDDVLVASLKKRLAIAVSNVREDSDKTRTGDRNSTQVLCAPVGSGEEPLGAIYLCREEREEEVESYLDLLNAASQIIEGAIGRFTERRKVERDAKVTTLMKRFHGPEIAQAALAEAARVGVGPISRLEQKQLVMLVADLGGIHDSVEKLPPDRVAGILSDLYTAAIPMVLSFEGTVVRISGDVVEVVFGAPTAHEDDAMRAVRAALALRDEWAHQMRTRPKNERYPMRVGLSAGPALVGTVGSSARMDFTALGEMANVAHWLCEAAQPGQILMTQRVRRLATGAFEVRFMGEELLAKHGKSVSVLELLGEELASSGTARIPLFNA